MSVNSIFDEYALKHLTNHVCKLDSKTVRRFISSNYFEIKSQTSEAQSISVDIRLLFEQIGVRLTVSDAPIIWGQWLQFGGRPIDIRSILVQSPDQINTDCLSIKAIPDVSQWLRTNLVVRSLFPSKVKDQLTEIPENVLDSNDLGGIVASLIADAGRGVFESHITSALPVEFDRILAWELAAHSPKLELLERQRCRQIALELASAANDFEKLSLLRWIDLSQLDMTAEQIVYTLDILSSIYSDIVLSESLITLNRILAHNSIPVTQLEYKADQVMELALTCKRDTVCCQALPSAASILAKMGEADTSLGLLSRCIEIVNNLNVPADRNVGTIALFLAAIDLQRYCNPKESIFYSFIKEISTGELSPSSNLAISGLYFSLEQETRGEEIIVKSAQDLLKGKSTREIIRFITVIIELLNRLGTKPIVAELSELAKKLIDNLTDCENRARYLLKLLPFRPDIIRDAVNAFCLIPELSSRVDLLVRLSEEPCVGMKTILEQLVPEILSHLHKNSYEEKYPCIAKACLLAGCPEVFRNAWEADKPNVSGPIARAIASTLALVDNEWLVRWVEYSFETSMEVPALSLIATLTRLPEDDALHGVSAFIDVIPAQSMQGPKVVEGVSYLFRQRSVDNHEIREKLLKWYHQPDQLSSEENLRLETQWIRVLDAIGEYQQAKKHIRTLLKGFQSSPNLALDIQSELLSEMPNFFIKEWLMLLENELLNRSRETNQTLINSVTCNHLALYLPPKALKSNEIFMPMYLGTVNLYSSSVRFLGLSWLARVGHQHSFLKIRSAEGEQTKEQSLLENALMYCNFSLPAYSDIGFHSRHLSEAAINLFQCGAVECALSLLKQSIDSLPMANEKYQVPFFVADAWLAYHRLNSSGADQMLSNLEQKFEELGCAPDALLVTLAEAGKRRWAEITGLLKSGTLERLSRKIILSQKLPKAEQLGALFIAAMPYPFIADRFCAAVLLYDECVDLEKIIPLLKLFLKYKGG